MSGTEFDKWNEEVAVKLKDDASNVIVFGRLPERSRLYEGNASLKT